MLQATGTAETDRTGPGTSSRETDRAKAGEGCPRGKWEEIAGNGRAEGEEDLAVRERHGDEEVVSGVLCRRGGMKAAACPAANSGGAGGLVRAAGGGAGCGRAVPAGALKGRLARFWSRARSSVTGFVPGPDPLERVREAASGCVSLALMP